MRTNMALGYLVLGLAVVLITGATSMLFLHAPAPPGLLDALRPCRQIVGGPTRVYVCARPGPHAWAIQGHTLIDLGPAGGIPAVPTR